MLSRPKNMTTAVENRLDVCCLPADQHQWWPAQDLPGRQLEEWGPPGASCGWHGNQGLPCLLHPQQGWWRAAVCKALFVGQRVIPLGCAAYAKCLSAAQHWRPWHAPYNDWSVRGDLFFADAVWHHGGICLDLGHPEWGGSQQNRQGPQNGCQHQAKDAFQRSLRPGMEDTEMRGKGPQDNSHCNDLRVAITKTSAG